MRSHILDELIAELGAVGRRISEIGASEASAGNLSICVSETLDAATAFPQAEMIRLPVPAPSLAGCTLLATGSGCRLREIAADPAGTLGALQIDPGGRTGRLYTAPGKRFSRLTSEVNSHLAVHEDFFHRGGISYHALAHAQPFHLTYLSHVPRYMHYDFLNRRLMRWEAETIYNLPEGIGVIPFLLPGSDELMAANVECLRAHRLAVWCKHGVMARSPAALIAACDLVEYAETAARYEVQDLLAGEQAEGLTDDELRRLSAKFGLQPDWL
jgi:rhamnulose-1-phosphate aldolase